MLVTVLIAGGCGGASSTAPAAPPPPPPPPLPTLAAIAGDGQTGLISEPLGDSLDVTVTNQAGAGVSGIVVSWLVSAGGGSVSASSVTTNAQGQAAVTWAIGSSVGTDNNTVQASAQGVTGSPVTFKASGATTAVYTTPAVFQQITASRGTPTVVNFDELDARPLNNTIAGRTPFDGTHYAGQGFTFASPGGYPLYIAPGGLFWNASNSLSVGHFPFDTTHAAPLNDADSLSVRLNPGCAAVSFELVDNGTRSATEFVAFFDATGALILKTGLPPNRNTNPQRAFVGLVSTTVVADSLLVAENANDGDDVDYDSFTCFHS